MSSQQPPGGTRPPPSDQSTPLGVIIKGIAGSPGVAVGPALVVGRHEGRVRPAPRLHRADRGGDCQGHDRGGGRPAARARGERTPAEGPGGDERDPRRVPRR